LTAHGTIGYGRSMRLLYISVHESAEFDDITMLHGLGHEVFPLGYYFGPALGVGRLRPDIDLGRGFPALRAAFDATGCRFDVQDIAQSLHLTPEFVALFDATIVMFLWPAIDRNWAALNTRPIILRTIGQGLDVFEADHARLRGQGVRVVRYAAAEAAQQGYAGADAVIHLAKNPAEFEPWRGGLPQILSFASAFEQRYPAEFHLWQQSVQGLPAWLGGRSNPHFEGVIGGVDWQTQRDLLRDCRAYFYCSGLGLPYTLNFIEAWMAAIPVVVMDPAAAGHSHIYWEIGQIITPGEDCLLVRDATEAQAALRALLTDDGLAARIGAAGRAAAIRQFGMPAIGEKWQAFLQRMPLARAAA
jgi:glycosyltransferase involved in cell wall biosynthesis